MAHTHRIAGLARIAALSLVLAAPLSGAAFADTAANWGAGQDTSFGADHANQALAAARAPHVAVANDNRQDFRLGQNNDFGSAVAPQGNTLQPTYGRLATTGNPIAAPADLEGSGGHMDQIYRQIYVPGAIPADNG